MPTCTHPYAKRISPDKLICLDCGVFFNPATKKPTGETITLPPNIYGIDQAFWKAINPWPLMPYEIAHKFEWYVSLIYGARYLVMPVLIKDKPVFYSARLLEKGRPLPKYTTPEGVGKTYWTHLDKRDKTIFLAEGIADAAYLSQLGSSVAVLGSYYDGSLDALLKNKRLIIVMDGDARGVEAAFKIAQSFKKKGHVNVNAVILPSGQDPTDLTKAQLKRTISKQVGGALL
jgi:5S rRNA maturation endonuclease (ribonuclease M5)